MTRIVNQGSYPLGPADEAPHPVGEGRLWNESYYLDFTSADGTIGGYVRLGLYPNWQRAWYWACLVRPGQPAIIIADNHQPLPVDGLTARGDGYAASIEPIRPLETARVVLDSAELGLDLEWRTAGGVYGYSLTPRYEIPSMVHGTIRVDDREIAFTGHGERDHSWGERNWWTLSWLWSAGRLDDGTYLHAMRPNLGLDLPWPCFTVPPGGVLDHRDGLAVASRFDAAGQPAASRLHLPANPDRSTDGRPNSADRPADGGLPATNVAVSPLRFASVSMTSPDGALAHFPRALCRFDAADGRRGYGWTEWHQPPGWETHGWISPALADARS